MFPASARALVFYILAAVTLLAAPALAKDEPWAPIPSEDLALRDNPKSPGDPAIILFRDLNVDGFARSEFHHYRIKILTEAGRKYADVEIPYVKDFTRVEDVRARMVRPDGTASEFTGPVYDKVLAKTRDVKVIAKALAFPDAQVGSIIEYQYRISGPTRYTWNLQQELYTLRAHFRMRQPVLLFWIYRTPEKKDPRINKDGSIELELQDIPAAHKEPHMPPELQTAMFVFFIPNFGQWGKPPEQFWKGVGQMYYLLTERFMDKPKAMQQEVARITAPADPPEAKLRKIYERVQQLRYVSYERAKTEKEQEREKLEDNKNVEDVLKRGYAYSNEINLLFVALARAAGLDASFVLVAGRRNRFFDRKLVDSSQLDAAIASVRLGSTELFFDPATLYCPFELLPWEETEVDGLRLDTEGGVFIKTAVPKSAEANTRRTATLHLGEDGTLTGTLKLAYSGREALRWRLDERSADDRQRKQDLEDEVKSWLPGGASVSLERTSGWQTSQQPLQAEVTFKVPGFGSATGRRLLLPLALFGSGPTPFPHAKREFPVYFTYPYQEDDEITLEMPEGYQVETLPAPKAIRDPQWSYQTSYQAQGRILRLERHMAMEQFWFPVESYPALRSFFGSVRTGDQEDIVMKATEALNR